jgi:hypothetical protein
LVAVVVMGTCDVYWGSHGCTHDRGHEGACECDCCDCPEGHHDDITAPEELGYPGVVCVAKPPYYALPRRRCHCARVARPRITPSGCPWSAPLRPPISVPHGVGPGSRSTVIECPWLGATGSAPASWE